MTLSCKTMGVVSATLIYVKATFKTCQYGVQSL